MSIPRNYRPKGPIGEADYSSEDRGYSSACWVWKHTLGASGSGRTYAGGKKHEAHRLMYEQTHRVCVLRHVAIHHLCGVRACIRPDHLKPMTYSEHRLWHTGPGNRAAERPALYALVALHETRTNLRTLANRLVSLTDAPRP